MSEGIIDRYSEDKGLGFIVQDDGREVVFTRASVKADGYMTLVGGDRVVFDVKETVRGLEAENVKKIQ